MKPSVKTVSVFPGRAAGEWIVCWEPVGDAVFGDAWIYRSFNGSSFGDPINKEPVRGRNWFKDIPDKPRNSDGIYYRVAVAVGNDIVDSPIGGLFGGITDREHNVARAMVNTLLTDMTRNRQGLEAVIYPEKTHGRSCPYCTPEEGLTYSTASCVHCFGVGVEGGYTDPFKTWVKRLTPKQAQNHKLEGAGYDDQEKATFTTVPWPSIRTGDLVIIRASGERWIAGEAQFDLFKGLIPVSCQFSGLKLLDKDVRFNLPAFPTKDLP